MTIKKPFSYRGLIDMSWTPHNLYNLHAFSRMGPEKEMNKSQFQLRWRAKQLTIPYHAGHLTQHQFRKQQQRVLPMVPRPPASKSLDLPYPPATMLNFAFLERHVDVALFRACFVQSIWKARYLVRAGHVTVNGKQIKAVNYVLEDGDIVQVTRIDRMDLLCPKKVPHSDNFEASKVDAEEDSADGESKVQLSRSEKKALAKKKKAQKYPTSDEGLKPVPFMAPWLFVPEYLEVNYKNLSFCFLRSPTIGPGKCEIPSPFDDITHQRAYDFYANFRSF